MTYEILPLGPTFTELLDMERDDAQCEPSDQCSLGRAERFRWQARLTLTRFRHSRVISQHDSMRRPLRQNSTSTYDVPPDVGAPFLITPLIAL